MLMSIMRLESDYAWSADSMLYWAFVNGEGYVIGCDIIVHKI